jgi:hypothetical protein
VQQFQCPCSIPGSPAGAEELRTLQNRRP